MQYTFLPKASHYSTGVQVEEMQQYINKGREEEDWLADMFVSPQGGTQFILLSTERKLARKLSIGHLSQWRTHMGESFCRF